MLLAGLAVFLMVVMAALPAPVQAASKITDILLSDKTDAAGAVSKVHVPEPSGPTGMTAWHCQAKPKTAADKASGRLNSCQYD